MAGKNIDYGKVKIAKQLLEESGVAYALSFKDCDEDGDVSANNSISGKPNDILNFLDGITSCFAEKVKDDVPRFMLENLVTKAVINGVREVYKKN